MSYPYHGQYPEDYSTPSTPHDVPYPQWEVIEQRESPPQIPPDQQQQQHQASPLQPQPPLLSPQQHYTTIQLEHPEHVVPSQSIPQGLHDNTPVRLRPVHTTPSPYGHEGTISPSGEDKPPQPPPLHIKTTTTRTRAISPVTSTILRPAATRARGSQHHTRAHPYTRPQSAMSAGPSTSATAGGAHGHSRFQRDVEQSHVSYAGQALASSSSAMPSPAGVPPGRVGSYGSVMRCVCPR